MMYAVLHCRKIKTAGGLAAVAKHNSREGIYDENGRPIGENKYGLPDWITRPDRRDLNALNQQYAVPNERIFRRRSQRISGLSRKPRKDAAHAVEAIYTASAEWFEGKSAAKIESFFEACLEWNEHQFGARNTLHWAIHYDEKTPHLHVLMTPITKLKRENGKLKMGDKERYSSADFLGGRDGLRKIQTEFAKEVGERHGLERGVEGSKARHTGQAEWVAELGKQAVTVEREKAKVTAEAARFEDEREVIIEQLGRREAAVTEREMWVEEKLAKERESIDNRLAKERETINNQLATRFAEEQEILAQRMEEVASIAGLKTSSRDRRIIKSALEVYMAYTDQQYKATKDIKYHTDREFTRIAMKKLIPQFDQLKQKEQERKRAQNRNRGMEW